MYLFFDTETNGLPKNPKAPMADTENWSRVSQLAWALYDEEEKLLYKECNLIKPIGWNFPTYESLLAEGKTHEQALKGANFFIENGYSYEKNMEEGIPIEDALDSFLVPLEKCKYIIAHNMMFDYNILGCEMIRLKLKSKNKPVKLCTKEFATPFCKIPNPNEYYRKMGEYKWPTLTELHNKLFNTGFEGAHDAINDVYALAKCFFEMKRLEVIKL